MPGQNQYPGQGGALPGGRGNKGGRPGEPTPDPRSQGVNGFSAGGYSPFGQTPLPDPQTSLYPGRRLRSMSIGSMGWGG